MSKLYRRHWLTLGFLALFGIAIGVFHNHQVRQGRRDPVTGLVRAVVIPLQGGVHSVTDGVQGWFTTLFRARAAIRQQDKLQAENEQLWSRLAQMEALRAENEQLRRLLALRSQFAPAGIASRVIAFYPQVGDQMLVLDKGSAEGVQVGAPVVASEGLVGVVAQVEPHHAQVYLLTSSRVAVSARVGNTAGSVGICEGQDGPLLVLNYLPLAAPVRAGDQVVTAGLGPKYPAGIPIGVVERVEEDRRYSIRKAYVKPFVQLEHLGVVLVVKYK